MATVEWGADIARSYDRTHASMFDDAIVAPTVELLAELAGGGQALEFAIGTGRIALPLAAAGVDVAGIEFSQPMVDQLRTRPGGDAIPVALGDMASACVDGSFSLVYLVFNTIMNVTTQAEQVAVFRNAAAHLEPDGCFVVEVIVPQYGRTPTTELGQLFTMTDDHVGIDTWDDPVGQISSSHHYLNVDGRFVKRSTPFRYVYPSELDLMAQLAGMHLGHRWAGWDRSEFTADSTSHVSVWRLP